MARTVDSKQVADLKQVMDSVAGDQVQGEDIPNISTAPIEKNDIINSGQYAGSYAAKSALAQHMVLATNSMVSGPEKMMQIRSELEPFVQQLKTIRLPDVRVNVNHQKIDVPWDMMFYSSTVQQREAMHIIAALVGTERMKQLRKLCLLAGQEEKPTLWLCQKLYIELKQPYIYTISRDEKIQEIVASLDPEKTELANDALKQIFGSIFYTEISHVADVNRLTSFALFILIFENVIDHQLSLRVAVKPTTTWDVLDG